MDSIPPRGFQHSSVQHLTSSCEVKSTSAGSLSGGIESIWKTPSKERGRGTPRHRGQGKGTRKGSTGPQGQTQKVQGPWEKRGRTGADPSRHRGLGKRASRGEALQHRGEPSRYRGLGNLTR